MRPRFSGRTQELCVKVEVAVLGSPSLIVLMVSIDVKQHLHTHTNKDVSPVAS